jgi:hypothetical protein
MDRGSQRSSLRSKVVAAVNGRRSGSSIPFSYPFSFIELIPVNNLHKIFPAETYSTCNQTDNVYARESLHMQIFMIHEFTIYTETTKHVVIWSIFLGVE